MKLFYLIGGAIFMLGSIILAQNEFRDLKVYKSGHFVTAKVVFVPQCRTTNGHYHFRFEHNGVVHVKSIGVGLCKQLKRGDLIKLKTNAANSIFLYENEDPHDDLIACLFLFLAGALIFIYGLKT